MNPRVGLKIVDGEGVLVGTVRLEVYNDALTFMEGGLNFISLCRGYREGDPLTFSTKRPPSDTPEPILEGERPDPISYRGAKVGRDGAFIFGGRETPTVYGEGYIRGEYEGDGGRRSNGRRNVSGALGVIRESDGTFGSGFYICLSDAPWLDGKYEVIGRVVSGERALDIIRDGVAYEISECYQDY